MGRILATLAIAAVLGFGCGESRQAKYERALREAEAASVDLDAAREKVAQDEASYEAAHAAAERAEAELEAARDDLDSATARLETARSEALKWAPESGLPPEMRPFAVPQPAGSTGSGSRTTVAAPASTE